MQIELWFGFVAACAVLTLVPGPCVLLVIGQSLSKGAFSAFTSIIGILIGDLLLMALSLMGVGALFIASPGLFVAVKWIGVAYMAYLGLMQIRSASRSPQCQNDDVPPDYKLASYKAGFLSAAMNPKGVIFYVAFLSQFIDPGGEPVVQVLILTVTSTAVVGSILGIYAWMAVRAQKLVQGPMQRRIDYTAGGAFLIASLLMASAR